MIKLKSLEASVYQEESAYKSDLAKKKARLKELSQSGDKHPSSPLVVLLDQLTSIEESRPVRMPYPKHPPSIKA